jgi:hypothetical protein
MRRFAGVLIGLVIMSWLIWGIIRAGLPGLFPDPYEEEMKRKAAIHVVTQYLGRRDMAPDEKKAFDEANQYLSSIHKKWWQF